jgi:hypothetical protein
MKKFLLTVVSLIAFSAGAMAQKPALNLMGEKPVDPRMEEYRKAIDREYNDALKKVPEQKKTNNDPWAGVRSNDPTKK